VGDQPGADPRAPRRDRQIGGIDQQRVLAEPAARLAVVRAEQRCEFLEEEPGAQPAEDGHATAHDTPPNSHPLLSEAPDGRRVERPLDAAGE